MSLPPIVAEVLADTSPAARRRRIVGARRIRMRRHRLRLLFMGTLR